MSSSVKDEMLERALALESRVVVNVGSGTSEKTIVGSLSVADDGRIRVSTGKPGRPTLVNRDDINNVSEELVEPRPEGVDETANTVVPSEDPEGDKHEGHDLTPAEVEANPDTEGQAPSFE